MSDTQPLIANELLAFLQQKLDVMDEVSAIEICSTNFSVSEICSAKELLYRSLKLSGSFVPHRRGDEKGSRTLQDIIKVFKETDPDDVPTFVAKELAKLPPVTFDHVDVTCLLKDIVALKASLATVIAKFDAAQTTIAELRDEVAILRKIAATPSGSATRSAEEANLAANIRRETDSESSTVRDASNRTLTQHAPVAHVTSPAPAPVPPPRAPILPTSSALRHRGAPAAATPPHRGPPAATAVRAVTAPRPPAPPLPPVHSASKAKQPASVDEEGFTLVEKKKRRARRTPRKAQCGTAEVQRDCTLQAATPNTALYVSRLHHSCVPLDVTEYVRQKIGLQLRVFKLEPRHYVHFTSFVVRVPRPVLDTVMKEDFWPKGVIFRRFRGTMPSPKEVTSTTRRPV